MPEVNENFKFIVVVIDCFSKYVWARPLKSKSGINEYNNRKHSTNIQPPIVAKETVIKVYNHLKKTAKKKFKVGKTAYSSSN